MSHRACWIVLIAVLASGFGPHAWAAASPCAAGDEFTVPDEPLPHVAAAFAAGGPLHVLALGSASTTGDASPIAHGTAPRQSFPYRMAETLQAARPRAAVQLTVLGGRGLTAAAMLPLLRHAMKTLRYQLVLWQTGTVEAVRGVPPDELLATLEDGAELTQRAGADLVLIDMQFSRFLRANADLDPYQAALQQAATLPGVVYFHRFDLMHDWAQEGRLDLESTARSERAAAIARLNACVGEVLARFVLNGAEQK